MVNLEVGIFRVVNLVLIAGVGGRGLNLASSLSPGPPAPLSHPDPAPRCHPDPAPLSHPDPAPVPAPSSTAAHPPAQPPTCACVHVLVCVPACLPLQVRSGQGLPG